MSIATTFMVDTVRTNAHLIPADVPYIGGYVSGLGSVPWTNAEWNRFSGRKIRNYQGAGLYPGVSGYDELDVEFQALTPDSATAEVKKRVDAGIQWTTLYGSRDYILATTDKIKALGNNYWNGHVNVRLADWSLNLAQATALIGTGIGGATIVGVQWASDSSNPNTVIPGTSLSLSAVGADLSVVNANWIPSGGFEPPVPAPVPVPSPGPTVPTIRQVTVDYTDGSQKVLV